MIVNLFISLVKRAVSHNASVIEIFLDLSKGLFCISDSGEGIHLKDVVLMSKIVKEDEPLFLSETSEANNIKFISRVISWSKKTIIESYSKDEYIGFISEFNEGSLIEIIQIPNPNYQGTRIIANFLPQEQLSELSLYNRFKRNVRALYLLNPTIKITITLKGMLNITGRCIGVESAFSELLRSSISQIFSVHASFENMNITAYLSKEFHDSDEFQFIYLQRIYVEKTNIYKQLNYYLNIIFSRRFKILKPNEKHYSYVFLIEWRNNGITVNNKFNIISKIIYCFSLLLKNLSSLVKRCQLEDSTSHLEYVNLIETQKCSISSNTSHRNTRGSYYSCNSIKTNVSRDHITEETILKWLRFSCTSFIFKRLRRKLIKSSFNQCNKNRSVGKRMLPIYKRNETSNTITYFRRERRASFQNYFYNNSNSLRTFLQEIVNGFKDYKRAQNEGNNFELSYDDFQLSNNTKEVPTATITYDYSEKDDGTHDDLNRAQEESNTDAKSKLNSNNTKSGDQEDEFERELNTDTPNQFISAERNPFIPKGSSPIMIIKDKSLEDATQSMVTELEKVLNIESDKLTKSNCSKDVDFEIYNIKNISSFSEHKKHWRVDNDLFNKIQIIGQLDRKYIMCSLNLNDEPNTPYKCLIVLDQHAVDERIQLEKHMRNNREPSSDGNLKIHNLKDQWITVSLTKKDMETIQRVYNYFEKYGFHISVVSSDTLAFSAIPQFLHWVALKRAQLSTTQYYNFLHNTIKSIINEQLKALSENGAVTNVMPSELHNYFCREGCLSAVNFGKELSLQECEELVQNISKCQLPFMCAHGRPVIAFLREISLPERLQEPPTLRSLKLLNEKNIHLENPAF